MSVVIQIIAIAGTDRSFKDPTWLKSADIEADGGLGAFEFTHDVKEAMQFPDAGTALLFWRTQSVTRPLRDDGLPNRPFTMYTVEIGPPEE